MKLLLVNPNTTATMTEKAGEAALLVAASGTEIIAVNPEYGPVSIEGYYDEVFSIPGLLEEVRKGEDSGCQGTVIACFDDTGLDAARCLYPAVQTHNLRPLIFRLCLRHEPEVHLRHPLQTERSQLLEPQRMELMFFLLLQRFRHTG